VPKHDRIHEPVDDSVVTERGQLLETRRIRRNIHKAAPGHEALFQPWPMAISAASGQQSKTRMIERRGVVFNIKISLRKSRSPDVASWDRDARSGIAQIEKSASIYVSTAQSSGAVHGQYRRPLGRRFPRMTFVVIGSNHRILSMTIRSKPGFLHQRSWA
jgi:hypothetical protein